MTGREVRRDEQTVAAYALTARRMANCTRTHCLGGASTTIEHRNGTGTVHYDAGYTPSEAWLRRIV